MTKTETQAAATFDSVQVGETLSFVRTYRGFVGGGEARYLSGAVTKVTPNTVVINGRYTLRRSTWGEATVTRAAQ